MGSGKPVRHYRYFYLPATTCYNKSYFDWLKIGFLEHSSFIFAILNPCWACKVSGESFHARYAVCLQIIWLIGGKITYFTSISVSIDLTASPTWSCNIQKLSHDIPLVSQKYHWWCLTIYICMRNSRGHNSFKNNPSATRRQYAQLGLVSIILVKLYWILTKGCWEIVFTRNVLRPTDRQAWLLYSPHILYVSGGIYMSFPKQDKHDGPVCQTRGISLHHTIGYGLKIFLFCFTLAAIFFRRAEQINTYW